MKRWFEATAARACADAAISSSCLGDPGETVLCLRDVSRTEVHEPPGQPWLEDVERAPAEDERGPNAADPAERRPPAGQAVHEIGPPACPDDVPRIRAVLPVPASGRDHLNVPL